MRENSARPLLQEAVESLRRNDTRRAEKLLLEALALASLDAEGLRLLGLVRVMQGRSPEGEQCFRQSLASDPKLWETHHNLGNLLRVQGRLAESATEQQAAIQLKPNSPEAHLALALVHSELGDHEVAEKSCRSALRIQPNFRLAQQTLAVELLELGRSGEAEQLLRRMLLVGIPDSGVAALVEHNLAIALTQQERFREALAMFDVAQAHDPNLRGVDFNRANVLQQMGLFEKAKESYSRELRRVPDHAQTLIMLGLMCALTSDLQGARRFAERALVLVPDNPLALIALAVVAIEENAIPLAMEKLGKVLGDPRLQNDSEASFALGYAADAFDRHERIADAFPLYSACNERRRRIHAIRFERDRAIDGVRRLVADFDACGPWRAWPGAAPASGPAGHVFLLGFMRCGTTLLEAVLAKNADVVVSDEKEFLAGPAREFLQDEAGLNRLAELPEQETARWRADYWRSVAKAGLTPAGRVFVDKMPFNSLRLPLVARLFPDAKILFAIRDPRDVVLSCFRRRFNLTPYSFEFLRLDDCAKFYDATMALFERYREKLPVNLREHRYENLVVDFDQSVRAVCDFIEIDWRESMRDFSSSAWAIDTRSASAGQIRQELYQTAVGQWQRYREHLTPILPVLEPWVRRFGYPSA